MKIGVIVANSNKDKNQLIYKAVCKAVSPHGHTVINFGVYDDEEIFSYVEISIIIGLLINRGIVDFVITGCSSGQGMMLACNNLPGVICGYCPTPQDAYLFGRINNGNAVSLPLGLNFGWCGEINLQNTLDALFTDEFGIGYPAKDSKRKQTDTAFLKNIKKISTIPMNELLRKLPANVVSKVENYFLKVTKHG